MRSRTPREFPFFSPVEWKIPTLPPSTAILHVSAIAKNVLHFTFNCVAGTISLSTIIQAGSQSIENLLHEGKHVSGVFIGAVS